MWCCTAMEKISLTDHVRNEEASHTVRKEHPAHNKGERANWIGHIWRGKCLLKHVIERCKNINILIKELRGRRRKQLLYIKETRGYWKMREEALDVTLWRTRFGSGCAPAVRKCGITELNN
jgi:hypothetical protein